MKTRVREKLEAASLHPLFVDIFCGDFARPHEVAVAEWREADEPIFTPGHEPVSKEGRELLAHIAGMPEDHLRNYKLIPSHQHGLTSYVRAYRDSLKPAPPEFEGWTRNGEIYTKGNNASVWQHGSYHTWQVDHKRDAHTGMRDTLPEAIKAANEMLRMLEPDPEGWHKTDGMAPPKEAGDRVIETVDDRGFLVRGRVGLTGHGWGDDSKRFRPIKWRYADGGQ